MLKRRVLAGRRHEGFTLLEVLVALVLVAIILTPLSMAFISMLRNSNKVADRLAGANDAQRIGAAWTRDVQSVDPTGVNPVGADCLPPQPATLETHLITFQSDTAAKANDAGAPVKLATWVVTGNGDNMVLERRYCENGAYKSTQRLATGFGISGRSPISIVHGPSGANRVFCPMTNVTSGGNSSNIANSCTIVMDGKLQYRLTVSRRVPELNVVQTAPVAPGPPTITGATGLNTHIVAMWTPPAVSPGQPPITGYRLLAFTDPNGNPVESVEVDGSSTSGDLANLANGTGYYLRVQAQNLVGWGDLSDPFGPVNPSPSTPERPTNVVIVPGDRTATVNWAPPANNGGSAITSYKVYIKPSSGADKIYTASGSGFSPPVGDLINGESYTATVAGINSLGEGDRSDTSAAEIPYGVPGKPGTPTLTSLVDGKIRVSWTAPSTNPTGANTPTGGRPITGYRIRVNSGGSVGPWPASGQLSASTTSYDVSGLTLGTNYSFIVEVYNLRGKADSDASSTALSRTTPTAPVSVAATASGNNAVKVTWSAPTNIGGSPVLEYEIRSVAATTTKSIGPSTFETTFTGLGSGTSYTFYVRARTAAGWGPEASASATAIGAPGSPTGVSVSRPSGSFGRELDVSWSAPSNTGGAPITYTVACTDSSNEVTTSTGIMGTSTTMTGLRDGRSTTCRVSAVNTAGSSSQAAGPSAEPFGECLMRAEADTFVNDTSRNANYGTWGTLEVNPSDERQSLMRFPLNGGSTYCRNKPTMTLPTTAKARDGGASITIQMTNRENACCLGTIYANTRFYRYRANWTETGATWNNTRNVDWNNDVASNTVRIEGTGWYTYSLSSGSLASVQQLGTNSLLFGREGDYWRMRKMEFPSRESGSGGQAELFYYFNSQAP